MTRSCLDPGSGGRPRSRTAGASRPAAAAKARSPDRGRERAACPLLGREAGQVPGPRPSGPGLRRRPQAIRRRRARTRPPAVPTTFLTPPERLVEIVARRFDESRTVIVEDLLDLLAAEPGVAGRSAHGAQHFVAHERHAPVAMSLVECLVVFVHLAPGVSLADVFPARHAAPEVGRPVADPLPADD